MYSTLRAPSGNKRRWLRHWLLAHSPSGIRPVPFEIWFTLPEGGAVDPYRLGRVRDFVISRIPPRDFSEEKIDKIRLAYDKDDYLFELLFTQWMEEHLEYVKWYSKASADYSVPLIELLKPPVVCYDPARRAYERNLYVRYGLLFKAWERYREAPPQVLGTLESMHLGELGEVISELPSHDCSGYESSTLE